MSATISLMRAPHEVNYTIRRGEVFERLIIPKDQRTRRKRVPTAASATVRIPVNGVDTDYVLPVEVTSEGGVLISLTGNNTEWFAVGSYSWDMVITVSRSALLTSTPTAQTLSVAGTLTVVDDGNITPMDTDGVPEALVAR